MKKKMFSRLIVFGWLYVYKSPLTMMRKPENINTVGIFGPHEEPQQKYTMQIRQKTPNTIVKGKNMHQTESKA